MVLTHQGEKERNFTLEVKEGAGVSGLLRGCLCDGEQVGAVTPKDSCHEAQEGLLDFKLKRVETLPTMELLVCYCLLHLHIFTVQVIS